MFDSAQCMFATMALLLLAACMPMSQPLTHDVAIPKITASKITAPKITIQATSAQWAEQCQTWDEWDKPAPPFRIHGDSYYVGTCGISAILITGSKGHVLIDSGTEAGADIIAANIRALGVDLGDVQYLLHSHEHFDHVGGFAKIQALTGAQILASPIASKVLRSGITDATDPQHGMHDAMAPVPVQGQVTDGQTIMLGTIRLNAIATPGHSPGALSWAWRSCADNACLNIVYADSLSPISREGYHFGAHPGYVARYRKGLEAIRSSKCDLLITPHPSASRMVKRFSGDEPVINNKACRDFALAVMERLDKRLLKGR